MVSEDYLLDPLKLPPTPPPRLQAPHISLLSQLLFIKTQTLSEEQ